MEAVMWENINNDSLSIGVMLVGSQMDSLKPLSNSWFASMRIGITQDKKRNTLI